MTGSIAMPCFILINFLTDTLVFDLSVKPLTFKKINHYFLLELGFNVFHPDIQSVQ